MELKTYLYFDGCCEEAINFYCRALGAEVEAMMRFKESPDPEACAQNSEEKIMHACFKLGGTTVMASDGRCQGAPRFRSFRSPWR